MLAAWLCAVLMRAVFAVFPAATFPRSVASTHCLSPQAALIFTPSSWPYAMALSISDFKTLLANASSLDTDLTRNTRAPHFTPQHWLLCHMGLNKSEFEFKTSSRSDATRLCACSVSSADFGGPAKDLPLAKARKSPPDCAPRHVAHWSSWVPQGIPPQRKAAVEATRNERGWPLGRALPIGRAGPVLFGTA